MLYASEWYPRGFWVVIIGVWSLHVDRYRLMTMQGSRPIDSVLWWCRANPAQSTDTPDRRGNSSGVWSRWVGNIPLYSTVEGISAWAIIVGFFTVALCRHECSQSLPENSVGASNWNFLDIYTSSSLERLQSSPPVMENTRVPTTHIAVTLLATNEEEEGQKVS